MTVKLDGAMLASLNIRVWQGQVRDHAIADQVESDYEVERGNISLLKKLVPDYYIHPIRKASTLGRQSHYHLTVPGIREGTRLLSVFLYDRYLDEQAAIKQAFVRAVNEFADIFPEIVKDAPTRLGRAYKQSDFPSPNEIKGFFNYDVQLLPVPKVDDWRLEGIADDDAEQLRHAAEANVQHMYSEALRSVYDRIDIALSKLADQIETFDPAQAGAKLRAPTIEAVKEIARLSGKMNVAGDEGLAVLSKQMVEKFDKLDAEQLRKDEGTRKSVAEQIKAIQELMR